MSALALSKARSRSERLHGGNDGLEMRPAHADVGRLLRDEHDGAVSVLDGFREMKTIGRREVDFVKGSVRARGRRLRQEEMLESRNRGPLQQLENGCGHEIAESVGGVGFVSAEKQAAAQIDDTARGRAVDLLHDRSARRFEIRHLNPASAPTRRRRRAGWRWKSKRGRAELPPR